MHNCYYYLILFTKNFKQLFFCHDVSEENLMKVFCSLWISNRWRTPTKHKMRLSIPDLFNAIKPVNFSSRLNIRFMQNVSHLTARQNKSRPAGKVLRIWMRGNNIFFPVKQQRNGKQFSYEQRLSETKPADS